MVFLSFNTLVCNSKSFHNNKMILNIYSLSSTFKYITPWLSGQNFLQFLEGQLDLLSLW